MNSDILTEDGEATGLDERKAQQPTRLQAAVGSGRVQIKHPLSIFGTRGFINRHPRDGGAVFQISRPELLGPSKEEPTSPLAFLWKMYDLPPYGSHPR